MRPCLLIIALCTGTPAAADIVVFRNGDRLSGSVIEKHDATLVFATVHSGTINIRWREILTLTIEKPVSVMLENGDLLTGETLGTARSGDPVLQRSRRDITLEDIAYINPKPAQSGIGVGYSGRANLAATDTSGNTTGRRIHADAEMTARARDYRYNIGAKMNRQQEFGVQSASSWRTEGNYDWFLDPRTFRYVRASFENDRFKDIDLRSTLGGGYGLQLTDDDRSSLSIRGGLDYVSINHIAAPSENYPALGWGLRASHRLDTHRITLFHEQDGYLRITEGSNVTLRSRTGVRLPIAGGMNASLQLNLDWDQEPAAGRKSTDTALLLGLGYEW